MFVRPASTFAEGHAARCAQANNLRQTISLFTRNACEAATCFFSLNKKSKQRTITRRCRLSVHLTCIHCFSTTTTATTQQEQNQQGLCLFVCFPLGCCLKGAAAFSGTQNCTRTSCTVKSKLVVQLHHAACTAPATYSTRNYATHTHTRPLSDVFKSCLSKTEGLTTNDYCCVVSRLRNNRMGSKLQALIEINL